MTAADVITLLGGGGVIGAATSQLLGWLLGRRQQHVTLADLETQIAERLLGRMDGQLHRMETSIGQAEAGQPRVRHVAERAQR